MIEINGMAHVILTVSEWDQCKEFYEAFLPFLGLKHAFSASAGKSATKFRVD